MQSEFYNLVKDFTIIDRVTKLFNKSKWYCPKIKQIPTVGAIAKLTNLKISKFYILLKHCQNEKIKLCPLWPLTIMING